jgi:hypothetical protein
LTELLRLSDGRKNRRFPQSEADRKTKAKQPFFFRGFGFPQIAQANPDPLIFSVRSEPGFVFEKK